MAAGPGSCTEVGSSRSGAFKLEQLVDLVQRKDRSRGRGSITPIVQGMTVHAGKGPTSPCGKVLRRTGPGFYELISEGPTELRKMIESGKGPTRADTAMLSRRHGGDQPAVVGEEPMVHPPGDSAVQRAAESEILSIASAALGVSLKPRRLILADGVRIEVDGASDDLTMLCEVWAHQGSARVGQGHKILTYAVKLHTAAQSIRPIPRLMLIVSDDAAVRRFMGKSWYSHALRTLGVEILVVRIPDDLRERIKKAQDRQFR